MKVQGPTEERQIRSRASAETREMFENAARGDRVCGNHCQSECPVCGRTDCRCACTASCPDMPAMLSSDGEKSPVEEGIAPLSFELKRLGCFEPCWSCEGHLTSQGEPWKIPQIWFYAESMTSIRVLSDIVAEMHVHGITKTPWEVALTYSAADTLSPTFALRPKGTAETAGSLETLQEDAEALASDINMRFRARTNALKIKADH